MVETSMVEAHLVEAPLVVAIDVDTPHVVAPNLVVAPALVDVEDLKDLVVLAPLELDTEEELDLETGEETMPVPHQKLVVDIVHHVLALQPLEDMPVGEVPLLHTMDVLLLLLHTLEVLVLVLHPMDVLVLVLHTMEVLLLLLHTLEVHAVDQSEDHAVHVEVHVEVHVVTNNHVDTAETKDVSEDVIEHHSDQAMPPTPTTHTRETSTTFVLPTNALEPMFKRDSEKRSTKMTLISTIRFAKILFHQRPPLSRRIAPATPVTYVKTSTRSEQTTQERSTMFPNLTSRKLQLSKDGARDAAVAHAEYDK